MAARGARGITGLSRRFRAADDSRNGSLCFEEFKKAITECAINLSEQVVFLSFFSKSNIIVVFAMQDFQNLFHHFDQDRSGSISFNEFLVTLRVRPLVASIVFLFSSLAGRNERASKESGWYGVLQT